MTIAIGLAAIIIHKIFIALYVVLLDLVLQRFAKLPIPIPGKAGIVTSFASTPSTDEPSVIAELTLLALSIIVESPILSTSLWTIFLFSE